MRKLIFAFILTVSGFLAKAQNNLLIVGGNSPDLYISHTVLPKENYYSIGRIYNISPKTLAPYNKLTFEKGLNPGQVIRIPLTETNFSQDGKTSDGLVLVPLYHSVEPKEGLYRISTRFNKVPMDDLKKWNKLSSDVVSIGNNLIIGYLKVKPDESPLASTTTKPPVEKEVKPKEEPKEEVKTVAEVKEKPKTEKEKVKEVAVTKPDVPEKDKAAPEKKEENKTSGDDMKFNGGVFKKNYESQVKNKTEVYRDRHSRSI